MSYTKGPWEFVWSGNYAHFYPANQGPRKRYKEKAIATVSLYGTPEEQSRTYKNVHLIAAAPELFEFCEWLLNLYENQTDDPSGQFGYVALSRLVKKAKGET